MKNFIENYLKISDYKITYFTNWRNNITCLLTFWWEKIIIQKENIFFPENQKYLINKLIDDSIKSDLSLAGHYLDQRFFEFEWWHYQVMNYINSTKISDEDFIEKSSEENIISTFKYLANFHKYSSTLNIPENKKNIWKTFKSAEELFLQAEELNNKNSEYSIIFEKIINLKNNFKIIETWIEDFESWIIHWDPAFKNFLFDEKINAVSLIDYEKVEYNNFMWDIADLIRSLLKVGSFDEKVFLNSIVEYEKIKKIPDIEKEKLINYLETLLVHLSLQYFLALFPESWVENKIWDNSDTIKKIDRCFSEFDKIKNWSL